MEEVQGDGEDNEESEECGGDEEEVVRKRNSSNSVVDLTLVLNVNVKVVLCQCGRTFKVNDCERGDGRGGSEEEEQGRLVPVKEGFEMDKERLRVVMEEGRSDQGNKRESV